MRAIVTSPDILKKLDEKHSVARREIEQCFENKVGTYFEDSREEHRTDPPTLWFVAPTNCKRMLKIVFVFRDGNIFIKSAYDATPAVIDMYERRGK